MNNIDNEKPKNARNWSGGTTRTPAGYIYERRVGHPRATRLGHYVMQHILRMEEHLGRYLEPMECVHHINGKKDDNDISNLQLMTLSEHRSHHGCKQMHDVVRGSKATPEHRQKVSEAKKIWWANKKLERRQAQND